MNRYTLGKYRFTDEKEYKTAKKEFELVQNLRQTTNFDSPKELKALYHRISSGEIHFVSQIGRDFDDEIYELVSSIDSPKTTDTKSKMQKSHTHKQKSEIKQLNDYNPEMQQAILKEMKKRERIRRIILCCSILILLGCSGYVLFYQYMTLRTQRDVEKLAALREDMQDNVIFQQNQTNDESPMYHANITEQDNLTPPEILPLYKDLYNQNKSLIGWIKIADTIIDYPVMQTVNNEYYLDHNFHQQYDKNGSIFMDAQCSVYPRSDNLILYGHHMKSGKMFGHLWKYESQEYYKKHPYIEFDTIYETGIYEVIFVFRDKVYSKEDVNFKYYEFINAYSEQEFDSYMAEMAAMSYYDTGVVAEYGDRLLTLSTCDYEQNNGRFVVVARKISDS